jgi:hypothetical protein
MCGEESRRDSASGSAPQPLAWLGSQLELVEEAPPAGAEEVGQGIRGFRDELSHGLKEDERESEEDAAESEERREREVATPRAIERH